MNKRYRGGQSGHAVIEMALLAPWIFFLFVGVVDVGFYSYAALSTQNAARVAALYTSSSSALVADAAGACSYVLQELNSVPLVGGTPTSCGALPVIVTANPIASLDGEASPVVATSVSVTVQTIPMIPIPGLAGQFTITRVAQMRAADALL